MLVNHRHDTRGAILPFLAIALVALIAILALLLDNSRKENSARDLQSSVDAAALAGVAALDSSNQGWIRVKRTVIDTLANNLVYASANRFDSTMVLNQEPLDPIEDPIHRGTAGKIGDWSLRIERGLYWWNSGEAKYEFVPLEGSNVTQNLLTANVPGVHGMPVWTIANAVRITVRLENIPASLAKQLGADSLGAIERVAIASTNKELEFCVAPLAIPACALMLDTRPGQDQYRLDQYDANMACPRELTFTEARFNDAGRYEGVVRSDSYPRPPYLGDPQTTTLNNRALPVRGILGLPKSYRKAGVTESERFATPAELGQFFLDQQGDEHCVKVKLGEVFRPVDTLVNTTPKSGDPAQCFVSQELPGFYDRADVEAAIAKRINRGEHFFREAFGMVNGGSDTRRRNFPYLRSYRPGWNPEGILDPAEAPYHEAIINWPTEYGGISCWDPTDPGCSSGIYAGRVLLADMDPKHEGRWTNPLCHSKEVDNFDYYGGGNSGAKVWRAKVPVIAPQDPSVSYCDWGSVFNGEEQTNVLPTSDTSPIVVGFVEADVFDFNIMNLEQPEHHDGASANTVYFQNRDGTREVEDRNPAGMQRLFTNDNSLLYTRRLEEFVDNPESLERQACLAECAARAKHGAACDPTTACADDTGGAMCSAPNKNPYEDYLRCFDYYGLTDNGSPTVRGQIRDSYTCTVQPNGPQIVNTVTGETLASGTQMDLCDVIFFGNPNPVPNICSAENERAGNKCQIRSALRSMLAVMAASNKVDVRRIEKLFETLAGREDGYIRSAAGPNYDERYLPAEFCTAPPESSWGEPDQPGLRGMLDIFRNGKRDTASVSDAYNQCKAYLGLFDLAFANIEYVGPNKNAPTRETNTSSHADREQLHCLPFKRRGQAGSDPASWQDPSPLRPQYGCGGLRARLRCNEAETGVRSFTDPEGKYRSTPMLVK